jgi:predicted PolB exonuclease-like 3'-5' exonuclease
MKNYIILDLETIPLAPSPRAVQSFHDKYRPAKNLKTPEAKKRHEVKSYAKFLEDFKWKANGMKVVAVGLGLVEGGQLRDVNSVASTKEKEVADYCYDFMHRFAKPPKIVGFYSYKFDFPQYKAFLARNGIIMPVKLTKWDWVDLYNEVGACGDLDAIAEWYGVTPNKFDFDGSKVEELYWADDLKTIEEYNKEDIRVTGEILQKLLGCTEI